MSAENQGGAGRREVAYRLFAVEFDDADFEYSEDHDERSPNYVVTPTGARVNRLFVAGVLTEVEPVNEDMVRARIVDPTGAFVVYAGQYQPDAQTFLERADPPQFVTVTGKARTFEPEDGDVIYTSIRPETISEVDAETRDRWVVQTARHTLDRIATLVDALAREERGEDLADALESEGVDAGLAEGIALAIDHYGTTTAYLDALRERAIQAAEVVADDREEVDTIELAPDEGGETEIDVEAAVGSATAESTPGSTESVGTPAESTATAGTGSTGETGGADEPVSSESPEIEPGEVATESGTEGDTAKREANEATGDGASGGLDDFGSYGAPESAESTEDEAPDDEVEASAGNPDEPVATDEMYEFDEEERREIEEEYGTEFNTGSEVEEPGEAAAKSVKSVQESPSGDEAEFETAESEATGEPSEVEQIEGDTEATSGETAPEVAESETSPEEVDLEDAVMETMEELDEGDGADREALVERVATEYGVDADEVEDAIQDALMSGKCYEPGDDRLKAI